jgi:organic hydroperoxide reductase OsmC/OhrA
MTDRTYDAAVTWSGTTAGGYRAYGRGHVARIGGSDLALSADAAFRGDAALPNPEQLVVAAAGSCQLLSFLAVAARAGIDVVGYEDDPVGVMPAGRQPMSLTSIELRPTIRVRGADEATVRALVERAHEQCYIANSLRADVAVSPRIEVLS